MKISDVVGFQFDLQASLERAALSLLSMVEADGISVREMQKKVEEMFCKACQDASFIEFTKINKQKNTDGPATTVYYVFNTGFKFKATRERVFGYTLKNISNSAYPYFGLYFLRESLLRSKVANEMHIADIYFDDRNSMNKFLNELADVVVTEEWKFQGHKSPISQPILKNFIEHSFYQAFCEEKILKNELEKVACMNTGLLDPSFNEIYFVCDVESVVSENDLFKERYIKPRIMKSSDRLFNRYAKGVPKPAAFYQDITELLFNCELASLPDGIDLNDRHIFEDNIDRINESLPAGTALYSKTNLIPCIRAFESALRYSLALAKRNYKLVAPQFWPETGKIQFLMPIYLEGKCEDQQSGKKEVTLPNVALCLEKQDDGRYLGTSILKLDMAYQNARLIAKPDSFWLEPGRISLISKDSQVDDAFCEGDITEFTYTESFINLQKDNAIIGLFGTIGEDEKAMLHISNLYDGVVTQDDMKKLVCVCQDKKIMVRVLQKNGDKGWNVGLKNIEPGFHQLLANNFHSELPVDNVLKSFDSYIGQAVTLCNLETTPRGGLRGTILESNYKASLSPSYLASMGIVSKEYDGKTMQVRITRWDENAKAFNVEIENTAE